MAEGKLFLFSNGLIDKKIYFRSRGSQSQWSGWSEFGGESDAPVSGVVFDGACHFFAKGMADHKIYTRSTKAIPGTKTWKEFGGTTDAAISSVVFGNTLYLFAKGESNNKIYVVSRSLGGSWGAWKEFGGTTDVAISPVVFKDRLYVFAKGVADNQIYVCSRPANGNWTPWQTIGGTTDAPVAAVVFAGDLHVFAKGLGDKRHYSLILGRQNAWSTWYPIPPVEATTDTAVAVASFANTLHLFAKGINDNKVYAQSMFVYELPFDNDGGWIGGGNWDDAGGGHGPGDQAFDFDFGHPVGGNVRAARSGRVVFLENNVGNNISPDHPNYDPGAPGYGTAVHIRHGDGSTAAYLHLKANSIAVKCQQKVEQGDIIGLSGDTGHSFGPHLHFGIHTFTNFGADCLQTSPPGENGPHVPVYFKDKSHAAWRPANGDPLTSTNA